ncbi:MAG: autotransporter-associated beta strand repeat-containing protein, partial [Planctomycetes bacterium]|nr:autotransporter-associated beta strand repeat-containing protein [Planctomycetota bacterium]
ASDFSLRIQSTPVVTIGGNQLTLGTGNSGEIGLFGGNHVISADLKLADISILVRYDGTKTLSGVLSGTRGPGGPDEINFWGNSDTSRIILTGSNTYETYSTIIYRGIVQVNSLGNANEAGSLGKNSLIRAGALDWNATIDYVGAGNSTDRQIRFNDTTGAADTGGFSLLSNGSGPLVFTSGTLNNYIAGQNNLGNRIFTLGGTNANTNEIQSVITNNKATGDGTGFSDTQGTIGITKTEAGRWILSGNNTYTGSNTVSAGLLIAAHANALGSTYAGTTVSSGASLGLEGNITTAAEALSITGTGDAGGGALRNVSGANTYAGPVTLTGDARIGADAGSLAVSGAITGTNQVLTIVGSGTVTLSNAGNTFGSGLTGITAGLVVDGGTLKNGVNNAVNSNLIAQVKSGTWDLNGYDQTIRSEWGKGLLLGDAAGSSAPTVTTGTGTLTIQGETVSGAQARIDYWSAGNPLGGVVNGKVAYSSPNNILGVITLDSTNADIDLTINAVISKVGGAGGGYFLKGGAGTLLLNGLNTFDVAAPRVDAGTLILGVNDPANGSAGALGQGTAQVTVGINDTNNYDAALLLKNGVTSARSVRTMNNTQTGHASDTRTLGGYDSTGTATFSGPIELFNTANDGGMTRLQALGSSTVAFSGQIVDNLSDTAVGINKIGAGTVVLSGSNSYRGATTVTAGKLTVNGVLGSGAVSVAAGSTLAGSGTIGGTATVSGLLSPGNSPGVLTLSSLVLTSTATTLMEINGLTRGGLYDGINLTTSGGLTYGGALSLSFGLGSAVADQTTFDLFSFAGTPTGDFSSVTSSGFYTGTWSQVASGTWSLVSGPQTLTFSAATGDIIVVPEPGALALAAAGIGLAVAAWARRRLAA